MEPADPVDALLVEALDRGQTIQLKARGQSMRPLIPDGSVVSVVPTQDARPGDVVAALVGPAARLVIHRLHGPGQTHGDGAVKPDITPVVVVGQVVRVRTPGGWIARLDTPQARIMGRLIARLVAIRAASVRSRK